MRERTETGLGGKPIRILTPETEAEARQLGTDPAVDSRHSFAEQRGQPPAEAPAEAPAR